MYFLYSVRRQRDGLGFAINIYTFGFVMFGY